MWKRLTVGLLMIAWFSTASELFGVEPTASGELLDKARDAFAQGSRDEAVMLAGKAITADPKNSRGYSLRGQMLSALKRPQAAVDDFNKAIELSPSSALYDLRGSEQFKLGRIDESIADFDRAIELQPDLQRQHWKRGISYYYAGRYVDGQKQFEAYQTFDDNDVENAVWRFLCMARGVGLDDARRSILKIRRDMRVPMMEVYDLFAGKLSVDDVLRAVEAGEPKPDELYRRRFYAHLYLGLYYDATGQIDQAREHVTLAADKFPIEHYMADVARVHARLLKR